MFRHRGKFRTFKHNLRLAVLLSFIAGLVNISGVLAFNTLTTNVTGHFAFFAEELFRKDYSMALTFLFYILSFLAGAFFASVLTEYFTIRHYRTPFVLSMIAELVVLLFVGCSDWMGLGGGTTGQLLSSLLLFSMGIQNSLVTQISNATVRTTHLTGLFTDLGIEFSQWFFYHRTEQRQRLSKSIRLRLAIITFFFIGCVSGGLLFSLMGLRTLLFAALLVLLTMVYDVLRLPIYIFLHRKDK